MGVRKTELTDKTNKVSLYIYRVCFSKKIIRMRSDVLTNYIFVNSVEFTLG